MASFSLDLKECVFELTFRTQLMFGNMVNICFISILFSEYASEGDCSSATPESSIHTEGQGSEQQRSPSSVQLASVLETPSAFIKSSPANYTQDFHSASPSPSRQVRTFFTFCTLWGNLEAVNNENTQFCWFECEELRVLCNYSLLLKAMEYRFCVHVHYQSKHHSVICVSGSSIIRYLPVCSFQSSAFKDSHSPAASPYDGSSKTKMQLRSSSQITNQAQTQPTDTPMATQTGEFL